MSWLAAFKLPDHAAFACCDYSNAIYHDSATDNSELWRTVTLANQCRHNGLAQQCVLCDV